ncbi:MAG: hypothetical protein AMXMBFR82_04260 [Candidatus Hydrogenedentota bacterium]
MPGWGKRGPERVARNFAEEESANALKPSRAFEAGRLPIRPQSMTQWRNSSPGLIVIDDTLLVVSPLRPENPMPTSGIVLRCAVG